MGLLITSIGDGTITAARALLIAEKRVKMYCKEYIHMQVCTSELTLQYL